MTLQARKGKGGLSSPSGTVSESNFPARRASDGKQDQGQTEGLLAETNDNENVVVGSSSDGQGGLAESIDPTQKDHRDRMQHWKDSPYAVGVVPPSWSDEILHRQRRAAAMDNTTERGTHTSNICTHACEASDQNLHDMCCCLILSGWLCGGRISCCRHCKARRIGNMIVLRERPFDASEKERVHDSDEDSSEDENDDMQQNRGASDEESLIQSRNRAPRYKPPDPPSELLWVLGPFWPCLFFATYPLVIGVSAAALVISVPKQPAVVQVLWATFTFILFFMLFNVSCRDPGILLRHSEDPTPTLSEFRSRRTGGAWRWNDTARTFHPRNARYDPDCKVVVEGYDHFCPWTGTIIGRKNMGAFQGFLGSILFCLCMNVFLLIKAAVDTLPSPSEIQRLHAKMNMTGEG